MLCVELAKNIIAALGESSLSGVADHVMNFDRGVRDRFSDPEKQRYGVLRPGVGDEAGQDEQEVDEFIGTPRSEKQFLDLGHH